MRRALRHAALLLSGWLTAGFAPSPSSSRRTVRLSSVVPQIDSRELLLALERLDNAFLTHLYEADADDFVTEPSTVTEEHAALARGFKLSADGSWRMDVHEGPKLYTRAAVASGDAFSLESDVLRALSAMPYASLRFDRATTRSGVRCESGSVLTSSGNERVFSMLRDLVTPEEVEALRRAAETTLRFSGEPDSIDGAPVDHALLVIDGDDVSARATLDGAGSLGEPLPEHASTRALLKRIAARMTPHVRACLGAGAETLEVSDIFLRRYGASDDERHALRMHHDGFSWATAVLDLEPDAHDGALLVQCGAHASARRSVPFSAAGGDVFVHRCDLMHGVADVTASGARRNARRLSCVFWFTPPCTAGPVKPAQHAWRAIVDSVTGADSEEQLPGCPWFGDGPMDEEHQYIIAGNYQPSNFADDSKAVQDAAAASRDSWLERAAAGGSALARTRIGDMLAAEGEVDAACYGASWLFLPPLSIARVTRAFSSTRSLGRRCVCR